MANKLPVYCIDNFKSEKGDEKGFYIETFRHHLSKHDFITAPHKHDFYLIILFTQGTGKHYIDFEEYPIHEGAMFFLKPGQVHSWELSEDIEGYILFHDKDFLLLSPETERDIYQILAHSLSHPPIYSIPNPENIIHLYKKMLEEATSNLSFKRSYIMHLLGQMYIQLGRLISLESNNNNVVKNDYIRNLELLIDKHYKQWKTPSDYSSQLNISTAHLNSLSQNAFGKSTRQLINDRIILEAKRLLTYSNLQIKQIGDELNFNDISYFIRFFRKQTGLTPEKFRKNIK